MAHVLACNTNLSLSLHVDTSFISSKCSMAPTSEWRYIVEAKVGRRITHLIVISFWQVMKRYLKTTARTQIILFVYNVILQSFLLLGSYEGIWNLHGDMEQDLLR